MANVQVSWLCFSVGFVLDTGSDNSCIWCDVRWDAFERMQSEFWQLKTYLFLLPKPEVTGVAIGINLGLKRICYPNERNN